MPSRTARWMLVAGAVTCVATMTPVVPSAQAQSWNGGQSCWGKEGRDRARCERDRDRNAQRERDRDRRDWDRRDDRRDRDRDRRDAKTDGIVAGVIGTAILGGIIAAAASSGNKKKKERREYCEDRYGNYDERTDSYRASDGRRYRCE